MNPWKILGVNRQMPHVEIHAAYLKLARKHHPDVNPDEAQHFRVITGAWALLKDEEALRKFEAQLNAIGKPCQNCKGRGAVFKQKGMTTRTAATCANCEGSGMLFKKEKRK